MTPIHDILVAGRELISDPSSFTQGALARDAAQVRCPVFGSEATCWCSIGAIRRSVNGSNDHVYEAINLLSASTPNVRDGDIATFNDTHRHSEVLAVWDKAIATAKARGI